MDKTTPISQVEVLAQVKKNTEITQDYEKRVARLKKYVEKVEQAQAEMARAINDGDFEAFSEEDIRFHLSRDPNMIAEAQLFLAKIRRAHEYAKNDTKTIRAKIRKQANQQKEILGLSSASDRDDYVQINPEYQEALKQEIEWKYRVEQMEAITARYENLFAGSRKLANLIQSYNKAQDDYVKYNSEG